MLKTLKTAIKENKVTGALYFKYFWTPRKNSPEHYIKKLITEGKAKKFIQIGANDGKTSDPFFRFAFSNDIEGIYIEPQKFTFENKLKNTYRNHEKIILENVAISDKDENRTLYKVGWSNERWATGLASFSRPTLEKQFEVGEIKKIAEQNGSRVPEDKANWIAEEVVKCMTIETLLDNHQYRDVDIIGIDTEGFDYEILKLIPFDVVDPVCIFFEHKHLDESSLSAGVSLLEKQGYTLYKDSSDFIGIKKA